MTWKMLQWTCIFFVRYIREKLNASLGKLETHEQAQEVEMLSKQVARLELALAEKIGPENAAKIKQGVTSVRKLRFDRISTPSLPFL